MVRESDADGWHRFVHTLPRAGEVATCRLALTRGDDVAFDALLACERREGGPAGAHVRVVLTDVTDLAQAEKALRESERWLGMSEAVTRTGHFVYEVGTVQDITKSKLLKSDRNVARAQLALAARMATVVRDSNDAITIQGFEGGITAWNRGAELMYDAGKPVGLASTERNITARKRAEEEREKLEAQVRMSQKMEAIGSLAGGVAHDFNNLLSVILSYTGFILASLQEGDPRRDDLLEVGEAADRAVALTRQLLAFSRKQVLQPVALDLNQVTAGVESAPTNPPRPPTSRSMRSTQRVTWE